jgi:hypothetical protein
MGVYADGLAIAGGASAALADFLQAGFVTVTGRATELER